MRKQGFSAGTSLALSLRMHERNKAVLLSLSKQYVSTNEYRLNRQTCSGIQSVPTSDLNKWRRRQDFRPLILTTSRVSNISVRLESIYSYCDCIMFTGGIYFEGGELGSCSSRCRGSRGSGVAEVKGELEKGGP